MDFGKLQESKEQKKGGTGLGLSICKQIVEKMGGNVTVSSELGNGAEFKIKLVTQSLRKESYGVQGSQNEYVFISKLANEQILNHSGFDLNDI